MRVIWSRDARDDQQRIWLFLAERSPDYADKVESRVEERANELTRFPMLGRAVAGADARRLSVTDVQYVIDYQIEGEEVLRILRVRSTREIREGA